MALVSVCLGNLAMPINKREQEVSNVYNELEVLRSYLSHESLIDDSRSGQANTVDLIDKVDDLVRSDRRVTLRILVVRWMSGLEQCGQLFKTGCIIGRCTHNGFRSSRPTSTRNCAWGYQFNICFGIMKTPLSWSGSSQMMRTGAIIVGVSYNNMNRL
ncbi:hypothetical protein HNY73_021692 [Argiope bruennichi]|uniref:Uncharacterized protein n=1 Tax=Argiope bruennichi TaxID=94029 RepID=A0A8T0E0N5_ARGBR|nr:hypothetical protein HNY73_021692 [Argiope bruennichi]